MQSLNDAIGHHAGATGARLSDTAPGDAAQALTSLKPGSTIMLGRHKIALAFCACVHLMLVSSAAVAQDWR
jgi:hypothetical protein